MKKHQLIVFILLAVVTASTVGADTYSWTDDQGTIHFSEDRGAVPQKYRKKARKVAAESPEEEKTIPAAAAKAPAVVPPATGRADQSAAADIYGGKTFAQWEKSLREREEAMAAVRQEIDTIDGQLRQGALSTSPLWDKRNDLAARFKEMKSEYQQLVESARKAGLQINIEK